LKRLSGEDRLSARVLYGSPVSFINKSKIWFCTNHEPKITGSDLGIWSRIRVIPFENTITPGREDKTLPKRLTAELPGILNWTLRGCLAWQEIGLKTPESVKTRTDQYRQEVDHFARFLAERCTLAPTNTVKAGDFAAAFNAWREDAGEKPETQRSINARIKTTPGIDIPNRIGKGVFYRGVAIRTESL
jgi:putative DNA primase/helicase